jgi:hypothetical protein
VFIVAAEDGGEAGTEPKNYTRFTVIIDEPFII